MMPKNNFKDMPSILKKVLNKYNLTESVLKNKGFQIVSFREWQRHPDQFEEELLLKNVPYETIYGHRGTTEFLLKSKKENLEIRIECKWQQSSGSVDEKLPYLYFFPLKQLSQIYKIIDYLIHYFVLLDLLIHK